MHQVSTGLHTLKDYLRHCSEPLIMLEYNFKILCEHDLGRQYLYSPAFYR